MARKISDRRQEVMRHGVSRAEGQGQGEAAAARQVTATVPVGRAERSGPMAKSSKKVRVRVKKVRK
jgi:hypothetical protein